jgi:hypothetical protein
MRVVIAARAICNLFSSTPALPGTTLCWHEEASDAGRVLTIDRVPVQDVARWDARLLPPVSMALQHARGRTLSV